MANGISFRVLGPVLVRADNDWRTPGTPQLRLALGLLALQAGQAVPTDQLVDALWDDDPPRSARNSLQVLVTHLRKAIAGTPDAGLTRVGDGYRLEADPGTVDVHRFRTLAQDARVLAQNARTLTQDAQDTRSTTDAPAAVAAFDEALALWRGPALADAAGTIRAAQIRDALAEERLSVQEDRLAALLACGRHAEAADELPDLLARYPLREGLARTHMLALYRCGRRADALSVFRAARDRIVAELGVEPGAELAELHQRILASDPSLDAPRPAPKSPAPKSPAPKSPAPKSPAPKSPARERPSPKSPSPEHPASPERPAPEEPAPQRIAPPPRQLPAPPRLFTGREDALKSLFELEAEARSTDGHVVIAAISGTAGVGKTALALHFSRQVAERFPDGQLYVNLRGHDPSGQPVPPAEAIRDFLSALDVPAGRVPAGADAQAGLYRTLLDGRRMLLVLDNARDAGQVRPLLPGAPGCLVLVTGRGQLAGLAVSEGARLLTLDVLSSGEADQLLARRLGPERVAAEPRAVTDLKALCARLPLALAITAAQAEARPGQSLRTLADELRSDESGGLNALETGDTGASVRGVFSWSYQRLSGPAARMFRLLGLHRGPDITASAAASLAGVPPDEARRDLGELAAAQLLTEQRPGRYAFHDLLRAYAAERVGAVDSAEDQREAVRRVLDHYLHTAAAAAALISPAHSGLPLRPVAPGTRPERLAGTAEALAWFQAERHVLLSSVDLSVEVAPDYAWQLAPALLGFFDRGGYWAEWSAMLRTALTAAESAGDPAVLPRIRNDLGLAEARLGHYEAAHAHFAEALSLHQRAGDSSGQAITCQFMAAAFEQEGRYAEALDRAEQALDLFRAQGQPARQLRSLNRVGGLLARLGEYPRALARCQEALDLNREVGDRYVEAGTWDSLGYIHHRLGDSAQAIACYRRALDLRRETSDRVGEATTLRSLGDAHHAAGHTADARHAWRQALTILEELRHPTAPDLRATLTPTPKTP